MRANLASQTATQKPGKKSKNGHNRPKIDFKCKLSEPKHLQFDGTGLSVRNYCFQSSEGDF